MKAKGKRRQTGKERGGAVSDPCPVTLHLSPFRFRLSPSARSPFLLTITVCLLGFALSSSAQRQPARKQPARKQSAQKQPDAAGAQAANLHQWGAVTLFHGLPSDRVRAIAQDADGLMWFGTDSGLAKYDGRRTQTVAVEGLAQGRVLSLRFDPAGGALWAGTEAGAAVLAGGRWRAVEETKGKAVTSILVGAPGSALLATAAGQLFECAVETRSRPGGLRLVNLAGADDSEGKGYSPDAAPFVRARAFPAEPLRSADADNPGELQLTSLTRDAGGALYVGTRSRGLLVARGEAFEEVLSRPRPYFVEALETDADGRVWVGARGGGAGLYAAGRAEGASGDGGDGDAGVGAQWRKLAEVQSAANAVRRGAGADLWVGTAGQGALLFRAGRLAERFTFEGTAGGLRSDNVLSVFVDREGVVWFGTDRGVCRFDPNSPRNEMVSPERESNFVRALVLTREGELLCGTNRGLFLFDARAGAWTEVAGFADKTVHALASDARGRLLVGTSKGLYAGASAGGARALAGEESEGSAGARAGAAHARVEGRVNGGRARDAGQPKDRVDDARDGNGTRARGDGARPNGDGVRAGGESVRAIREFGGATYVATYGRGVERLDGERRALVWPPSGSDATLREVTSLYAEGDARLWIGTADAGLHVFEGGAVRRAFGEHLRGQAVWAVEGSVASGLWIASSAGLYYSRDGESLETIVPNVDARAVVASAAIAAPAAPDASDTSAAPDAAAAPSSATGESASASSSAWVATAGAGLLRVRLDEQFGPVVSRLDVEQGLASSHAFALLRAPGAAEGGAESLIVGTTRGVVRYRPGGAGPALVAVRVLSRRLHQPPELREGFTLPYPQNSLALDVAALSTRTFPEQFQYAFVLRGGGGRELRRKLAADAQFVMENLQPGTYTVEARAFTKDLNPSAPLGFSFTVGRAPFPRTTAALSVLLVLALVALAWGAWQNRKMARATSALAEANHELAGARLNLANEAERERRRIARDLHDQTLADLRSLMLLTDQLPTGANGNGRRAPDLTDAPDGLNAAGRLDTSDSRAASGGHVDSDSRVAADRRSAINPSVFRSEIESISDEIRRICEDLSPSALDNVGLAAALEWALTNSAAHCPEPERFEYEFAADEDFDERLQVEPGVRMQIYRIAQEAITNVCRHARARRVRLSVTLSAGGELLLTLEDDGRADFDPRARRARRGRGLASIRDRASLIEAEADWQRLPGGGTRFTLRKTGAAAGASAHG